MRRHVLLMMLPALAFLSIAFVLMGLILSYRLAPEHRRGKHLRWLASWFVKGLILPALTWFLMNIGLSLWIQPFMPQIQYAQTQGGPWFGTFLIYFVAGFFIVTSYWAAITLGWTLLKEVRGLQGDALIDFKGLCATSCIGAGLFALGIVLIGHLAGGGFALVLVLAPIAGYAPGILGRRKMTPMYARAIAKMKFGKYREAELDVINELEKREDDFDGWMMLADLYANQFHDLPEAEQTILEICDQPKTTPSQIGIAFNRLADWHLKISQDPEAARRVLLALCDRLRNTHMARMAQLRMNQLPRNAEELREQQTAAPIRLPALGDQLDDPLPIEDQMDRRKAAAMANSLAAKLSEDPNNVTAREKFARILTERLNKPELGIEQITLLLNMPDQENARRAEWLSTMAAWHIRYRGDSETGLQILERIVREFPNSPQALAARRRIHLLQMEAR
jgi:hypothetical protein